jgi:hypothetical protein
LQSNGIALEFIVDRARVLHYLRFDFVTMRSRLERDPRKNNGLVRCGMDQTREWHLTLDVEVVADAFSICQGPMLSPDLTCF